MSHTPGPWEQMPGGSHGSLAVWNKDTALVVATAGGITASNALDNARLIAAAPDLLAALEALTAWAETVPTDYAEDDLQRKARAAIAKATQ
jgi:hypothetical protein